MVEVCHAWNHGRDGHFAERMTSGNNISYTPSQLGGLCGTSLHGGDTDGKVVLRRSSNLKTSHQTAEVSANFCPRAQMDLVDVFARKEILSPLKATAAQLHDVPAPTSELPSLENGDGQVAVTDVGMFNEPSISHRGHEHSGADMIGEDG